MCIVDVVVVWEGTVELEAGESGGGGAGPEGGGFGDASFEDEGTERGCEDEPFMSEMRKEPREFSQG